MPNWRISIATLLAAASACCAAAPSAAADPAEGAPIILLAAGSLRNVMTELGQAFQRETGVGIAASYGPSGGLRAEIEAGRPMDVFASASTDHTNALVGKKLLSESAVFAYNDLCVLARPEAGLNENNLLEVIQRPALRLATSTPVSDPMGDYTWQFFRNADKMRPGSYTALDAKALKLSGASAPPPGAKLPYVTAFEDNKADAYIMYCTNAVSTRAAVPGLDMIRIPDALNVRSSYGIGPKPSSANGARFVQFVLSQKGKEILRRHGFN